MIKQIGKYELTRVLGQGASATVYLGIDTFSGDEVAVKVIDPAVFENAEHGKLLRKQFLNEASLAGKLEHPHIVSILDAVVDDSSGYIAMEFVPGGDLSAITRPQKLLPVESANQIGFKCCGALDYAYRQGIVHRYIKPANIMVVHDTDIKITDFGAAYLQKSESTQLAKVGTPFYLSPEQISASELTHHSDMFCLGVVLYELLTGVRPFNAPNVTALFQKIGHEDPAPPSQLGRPLSPEVDNIILTALKKNPADRFPTWADFALALARVGRLSIYEQTIPDSERYESLRRVDMLKRLSDAEIWELVNAGKWTTLPPQRMIIREDEPGRTLFFLAKGELKITKQGHLLNVIGAGECFGEMGYIRGGELPRQATVESMTDVVVAEFDPAALKRLSHRCQSHFTLALLRTLVDRLALAGVRISQVVQ